MAQQVRQTELGEELIAVIMDQVEQTARNIQHFSSKLSGEIQKLERLVDSYHLERVRIFEEKMRELGMTWCTGCAKSILEKQTLLVFVEETRERSGGYQNSEYWFDNQRALHRVCPDCQKKFFTRHGWKGEYDRQSNKQACFHVFNAEKREDGYYAYRFGNWIKIEGKVDCLHKNPPECGMEKLANEVGFFLPPKIQLQSYELVVGNEAKA